MTDARIITESLGGRWHGRYGTAACPVCQPEARRDQDALTLADGRNGRLVLHCKKAACPFLDILAAAGLRSGEPPATSATPAQAARPVSQVSRLSQHPEAQKPALRVASVAGVATPPDPELIRDLLEERAAIREYDGGQARAEAEAGAVNDVSRSTCIAAVELSRFWQSAW